MLVSCSSQSSATTNHKTKQNKILPHLMIITETNQMLNKIIIPKITNKITVKLSLVLEIALVVI